MKLFDLHCDTLYECYNKGFCLDVNPLHIDLTRGEHYAPWCQVFAAFMPDTIRGDSAWDHCRELLHHARAQAASLSDKLVLVTTCDDLKRAVDTNRCGGILAVEGGAALAGRVESVKELARLGVRVLTLTWNGTNELGHGCLSDCAEGLTPFGKQAVRELERWGIVPDVSHLNEAGFWDVAACVEKPFIASHSVSCVAHDHPRNLTDAQFSEIARRGGVVGVNFCRDQLGEQTFDGVRRHLEHFLSLGGETTVALGGDLDGTDLPASWHGIAVYERLADELAKKGWKDRQLDRVFYQNAANFFAAALQEHKNAVQ